MYCFGFNCLFVFLSRSLHLLEKTSDLIKLFPDIQRSCGSALILAWEKYPGFRCFSWYSVVFSIIFRIKFNHVIGPAAHWINAGQHIALLNHPPPAFEPRNAIATQGYRAVSERNRVGFVCERHAQVKTAVLLGCAVKCLSADTTSVSWNTFYGLGGPSDFDAVF